MGDNVKAALQRTIVTNGPISAHALTTDHGVSRQYVHRILTELVKSGAVIKTGKPPRVLYSANPVYTQPKASNLTRQTYEVSKQDRLSRNKQRASVLWVTGLSGSGKSTLASAVEKKLFDLGKHTYVLDGDNIRHGLNRDLTFSAKDRAENIRRIGEASKLFIDGGMIVLTAFISPYTTDRNIVRSLVDEGEFVEIYTKCPLDVCEQRDPKGLYKKARAGQIKNFTGIDAPYEEPENPEIVVETDKFSVEECVDQVVSFLIEHSYIKV